MVEIAKTAKERFKLARKKLRLTQSEIGNVLGVSAQVIANIETGRTSIDFHILQNLQNLYKINPSWLLEGNEEMFLESQTDDNDDDLQHLSDSELLAVRNEEVKLLKEEITRLENQLDKKDEQLTNALEMLRTALGKIT